MTHRIGRTTIILALLGFAAPALAADSGTTGTFQTEMISMDLRAVAPSQSIDLDDGAYRDRQGNYVVVKNRRVVEKGDDYRKYQPRARTRPQRQTPDAVKSNEKPERVGLLVPAVQAARAGAPSGQDDCGETWMKYELEDVMVTSFDINASGNDEALDDGNYKTETGGYAIVRNGKIVSKGNNWRAYRSRSGGRPPCSPLGKPKGKVDATYKVEKGE